MHYSPQNEECPMALNPFKACVAPRPIGWISTVSRDGIDNLAPFSQFQNLSYDPPMVMIAINQGGDEPDHVHRKDTVNNIESTGCFVYNAVPYDLKEQMNITASGFAPEEDEFEKAGLHKAESVRVAAKRVAESPIQFECEYMQTMRTFHTGGVAGDDITQGLPRVEELFEARKPKGLAIITEFAGTATISDTKKKREIIVTNDQTGESKAYLIPYGSRIKIQDGVYLEAGDELTEGSVNPHDILKIKGLRAVQDYMIQEVQRVYRLQGVEINDKHIEVIVRQMLKKIRIEERGDTEFLPGTMVDVLEFNEVNEQMEAEGKEPATGEQIMLGITKASLATESFLSAASFQETTKVLTEAAIKGKVDHLIGLKENVIIGKHIPAGTGMKKYRDVQLNTELEAEEEAEELDESDAVETEAVETAESADLEEVVLDEE